MILNQRAVNNYGPNLQFYIKKGLLGKYDNFKQFADKFGIDYDTLLSEIRSANKTSFNELDLSNFYKYITQDDGMVYKM